MRDRALHPRSCFLAATFLAALITTCFGAIPTTSGADSTTPIVQLSPSDGTVPAGSQFTVSWTPANVPLTPDQSLLAYELCYGSGSGAVNSAQAIQIPSSATQSAFAAPNQVGVVSDIYFRAIYGTTGSAPSVAPCAAMVLLSSAAHVTFTTVSASSATATTSTPATPTTKPISSPVKLPIPGTGYKAESARLVGSGATSESASGYSTAMSADGKTALVGGPASSDPHQSGVWVFVKRGGRWVQQLSLIHISEPTRQAE